MISLTIEPIFQEDMLVCPTCKHGEVVSKIVNLETGSEGDETYFYSCGHRTLVVSVKEVLVISDFLTKIHLKSTERIKNKPKYETVEKYQMTDWDNPGQLVEQIFYIYRNSTVYTIIFQVVKYNSGIIKHIHCKFCDTEWDYHQKFGYKDLFNVNFETKTSIECLYCHAKIER